MFSWEHATSGLLDPIGLRRIKIKIIAFALLATLMPSLTMGWLSYRNNRRAIDEKIVAELTNLTSHASREVDLWFRERRYEMKVLASSYEVSENLEKLNRPGQIDESKNGAQRRLEDYLRSVAKKFVDYEELSVVDGRGKILASSVARSGTSRVVAKWLDRARTNQVVLDNGYFDKNLKSRLIIVSEPIRSTDGAVQGALIAKVRFDGIDGILERYTQDPSQELYLVARGGEVLISSRDLGDSLQHAKLDAATLGDLFRRANVPRQFLNFRGNKVLGTLLPVDELDWGVVAEKDRATAYSAIARLKNVTLTLISSMLVGIGLAAYLLGLTIVRPLDRLTHGAAKVAGGDLDVNLPIHGHSEISYMTTVFNDMVARLRKLRDENVLINQELRERNDELRRLSVTDSLTGLYNRTELSDLLAREVARSRRHHRPLSLLMADIDYFKRFNDSHGHQAGDDLLRRFAEILRDSVRACDIAARYGGEEFLILLTETEPEGAMCFAEKIRERVEAIRWDGKRAVTISIGVASMPESGEDVESLIRQADAALYQCKREGRNRVAAARTDRGLKSSYPISSR